MERIPLHSWEMEFSIQYHVTINSQLNDQNSIWYYIKANIISNIISLLLHVNQTHNYTILKQGQFLKQGQIMEDISRS
jgi:hypothetical protein